jgi:hypothetical protein
MSRGSALLAVSNVAKSEKSNGKTRGEASGVDDAGWRSCESPGFAVGWSFPSKTFQAPSLSLLCSQEPRLYLVMLFLLESHHPGPRGLVMPSFRSWISCPLSERLDFDHFLQPLCMEHRAMTIRYWFLARAREVLYLHQLNIPMPIMEGAH